MKRVGFAIGLLLLGACQQTKAYTPELIPAPASVPGLSGAAVLVTDLRTEKANGETMQQRLADQLRLSIPSARPAGDTLAPRLLVDVIEQRAYFTAGKWHGITRLRARVEVRGGTTLGPWSASGESERFNSVGYTTAKRVAQDSYNAAVADLVSQLRSVRVP